MERQAIHEGSTGAGALWHACVPVSLPALLGLILCACTPAPVDPSLPAPGTLKVVSVEPVSVDAKTAGIIANPNFSNWWAGAPCPEGFGVPDPALSTLERIPRVGADGFIARQSWTAGDTDKAFDQTFRVDLGDLEANKTYVLVVEAASSGGATVHLNLLELGNTGKSSLELPFLQLVPSEGIVKRYLKRFTPTFNGRYALSACAKGRASVSWFRWEVLPEWAAS